MDKIRFYCVTCFFSVCVFSSSLISIAVCNLNGSNISIVVFPMLNFKAFNAQFVFFSSHSVQIKICSFKA